MRKYGKINIILQRLADNHTESHGEVKNINENGDSMKIKGLYTFRPSRGRVINDHVGLRFIPEMLTFKSKIF